MPKVLLVEDDNNLREIFEMRLTAEGYQTVTASNGEEGLTVAMKEKPDLIIADVMMPKLSGFEMLETLRASPEMKNTKAIMMTALGQAEDQARGANAGVVKYLVKSQVTLEDFVRVVREVLPPSPTNDPQPTNKQESESKMPEDNQPMNPDPAATPPADPAGAAADPTAAPAANPISNESAMPVSGDSPMTTAQAQDNMNSQINSFAGSPPASDMPAPAADSTAPAPESGSIPVSAPPAESEPAAPAEPQAPAAPAPDAGGMPPAAPTETPSNTV